MRNRSGKARIADWTLKLSRRSRVRVCNSTMVRPRVGLVALNLLANEAHYLHQSSRANPVDVTVYFSKELYRRW